MMASSQVSESRHISSIEKASNTPIHRSPRGSFTQTRQHRVLEVTEEYLSEDSSSMMENGQHRLQRRSLSGRRTRTHASDIVSQPSRDESRQRTILGFGLLAIGLLTSTIQTETTAVLQATRQYKKPYFILWWAHVMWALVLPVQLLIEYIRAGTLRPYRQRIARSAHYIGPKNAPNSDGKVPNDDVGWRTAGWRPLILGALCISPLFNASTYLWYLSAGMTSAGALAAINSTSSCFVYIFSVLMINEPIRLRMIMAVLISVAGVLFMSVSDGMTAPTVPEPMPISLTSNQTELVVDTLIAGAAVSTDTEMVELHARSAGASPDQPNSFLGDILCLLGAAFSGFFQVTYKQHLSPHRHNTTEFAQTAVGLIGIFTFLVCWIPIPILHLIGWEPFQMPDLHTFGLMSLIGILSAISNACFTPLIALISPLFASVGTMLQIPMVAITDWIVQGKPITFGLMMGSIAICVGFFMLSTAKPAETIHEEKNRSEHDEGEHVPMLETGFADEETAHLSSQTAGLHTKKEVHGEVVDWAWEAQWSDDDALSNYANQADYQSRN